MRFSKYYPWAYGAREMIPRDF